MVVSSPWSISILSATIALSASAQSPHAPIHRASSQVGLSQAKPTSDTVTIRSGNVQLRAVLWQPRGRGPFPGILVNHGSYENGELFGPDDPGSLGRIFAEHGYVCLVLFRRGTGPSAKAGKPEGALMAQALASQGQAGRNRVQLELLEGEAMTEAMAGLAYLRGLPIVEPTRVAIVGHSFGGSLSILLAAKDSTISAAVLFGAAAGSWATSPELQQQLRAAVRNANAVLFFIHAANDYSVEPGKALDAELEQAGKPHQLKIYPAFGTTSRAGHNFIFRSDAWRSDVFRFLDARLRRKAIPTIELRSGLLITQSVRIAPRTYRLSAPLSLESAVITIRGDDLTVDFAGASLVGIDPSADPDQARGIGVRIDGGRNVRVLNATVRGYKVGLLARGTRDLTLARDDFSHNWKPRLFSAIEHESLVDWLSHHHNEQREWLRFGAGAYLEDVHRGEIHDVRIEHGMEGLMLVRSDSVRVWNNVIEFNSGVGIGLYRSSDNVIMHNRASYNVRGYSHGFYRRGQDSANLLLYEQSCRNVVAYNSMTHGGDGLFLWAGQSTMDTGEGGSNDNLFYANDFSFAPTNGMEATFSRNVFAENRVEGSDYGLWAGYSFDSRVVGNHFTRNRTGVAIEHGQNNTIARNRFDGDTVAVYLWANPIEPGDWGYPKHRDTRSRDYVVATNTFIGNRVGVRSANTTGTMVGNRYTRVDSAVVRVDTVALEETGGGADIAPAVAPAPIAGGVDARALDSLALRDRAAIIVDEWGPYDWRSPKLWPVDSGRGAAIRLRVLGPTGTWRVVGRRGIATLSSDRGRVGDTVTVTPSAPNDWTMTLEYRGGAVVSPRGARTAVGTAYRFSYSRFEPMGGWHVAVFPWTDATDPRSHPDAFATLIRGTASVSLDRPRLDLMWYRPTLAGVPAAKWAAVATTTLALDSGTYTLRTISDDGVRVWLDDKLVIDAWTPHESRVDNAPVLPGRHTLRAEYYQVDGWAELRVDVVRGRQQSTGSPGPH